MYLEQKAPYTASLWRDLEAKNKQISPLANLQPLLLSSVHLKNSEYLRSLGRCHFVQRIR